MMTVEQLDVVVGFMVYAVLPCCVLVIWYGIREAVWGWRRTMLVVDVPEPRPAAPKPVPFIYSDCDAVEQEHKAE